MNHRLLVRAALVLTELEQNRGRFPKFTEIGRSQIKGLGRVKR